MIFSILLFLSSYLYMAQANAGVENWCIDEMHILETASHENKPIVLAFIKMDDCPWSQKMKEEILYAEEFIKKMRPHVLLWHYFLHSGANPQEEAMRKKFKIDTCPTVLLLDPHGREFARFGYQPLDAQAFGGYLLDVISDFKEICAALDGRHPKDESIKWKDLYHKSKQLSRPEFKKIILEKGIKEDPSADLFLEKYLFLLENNKLKDKVVKECRQMLIDRDPKNHLGTHFHIALAEFHKLNDREKTKKNLQKTLSPLLCYLQLFEEKDTENAWRVEMVIANYLLSRQKLESALAFAQKAYQHAPEAMKNTIAEWISSTNINLTGSISHAAQ